MSDTPIAVVQKFERVSTDDGHGVEVTADASDGQLLTLYDFPAAGEDAPPLPGDFVATAESTGKGNKQTTGYVDAKNPGKALGGEKRTYARDTDGVVVAEIWMHGDGLVEIMSLKAGGRYKIGKVLIDEDGNIKTPGEVTAKADTPQSVALTTHLHGSGTGPTAPPTAGT